MTLPSLIRRLINGRLLTFNLNEVEVSEGLTTFKITLVDALSMEPLMSQVFERIAFPLRSTVWANEHQLVVGLANDDELYRWLVWSPFENRQEVIEVQLEGIGDALDRYHTGIPVDPLLELVIYPCQHCPPAEYLVRDVRTGELVWSIDLGPHSTEAYRGYPLWSPDGQYIALVNGDPWERQLWVLDRQGEEVYRIDDSLLNPNWSPDGRYLAFGRVREPSLESASYSLTVLDLKNNELIDLCVAPDPPGGPLYWSWDSAKIAFNSRISELDNPKTLIHVVEIGSGDTAQVRKDGVEYRIDGWVRVDADG